MEPNTPLPADVPDLPPGRFYRVTRDGTFSFPVYAVEIRQQHKRFSTFVARSSVELEPYTDVAAAMRDACCRAYTAMRENEERSATWTWADGYVGDHGREDAK